MYTKRKTLKAVSLLALFCAMVFGILAFKIPKPKVLYTDMQEKIFVLESGSGKNTLRFLAFEGNIVRNSKQGAIYPKMPEKIALNYAKMMLFGMQFSKNPKKILVIGMGIGTIPQEINKFFPKAEIDIVEISSKIPPIAEEFFDFKKTDKIKIFIQDGYDFILNSKPNIYDVIFSDAFDGTYIPAKMLTNKYLLGIKNVLKEDGILIMNTFEKSESYQKEEKLVTDNFESVFEIVNNNRILFASKNPLIKGLIPDGLKNKIDFKENSLKLKKLK